MDWFDAPREARLFRQCVWSILLKAFSRSIDIMVTAERLSSRHSIWSVSNSVMRCSVLLPLTPPNWKSSSLTLLVRVSIIKDSHSFEKIEVQLILRHSSRVVGAAFLGITVPSSSFQIPGQPPPRRTQLIILARGAVSLVACLARKRFSGSISTLDPGFLIVDSLSAIALADRSSRGTS